MTAHQATTLMKITPEQIESMPALLESDYCEFRTRCREALSDSLENGDAIQRMKTIYGDFMRAFLHTMEEYDTPKEVVNELLTTL